MLCSISGEIAKNPVISKFGHIYEKELVEKHIQTTGKCPVTDEELTIDDIITIKTPSVIPPRDIKATSLPNLITIFQNEWDSLTIEAFTLKKHISTLRTELSHALYQHDAACRLKKENGDLKKQLRDTKGIVDTVISTSENISNSNRESNDMDVEAKEKETGIPDEIISHIKSEAKILRTQRKKMLKMGKSDNLASSDTVSKYSMIKSFNLHKPSNPGVTSIDICPQDSNITASGGNDGEIVIHNKESGKILNKLKGHTKTVIETIFHHNEPMILSCSADSTCATWSYENFSAKINPNLVKFHNDIVTGLALHPTGKYYVSSSLDKTWTWVDIHNNKAILQSLPVNEYFGYTCTRFHPDGLILATGTVDGIVRIWDSQNQQNVVNFDSIEKEANKITSINFSENGTHFAVGNSCGRCHIYDLRKSKLLYTIEPSTSCINSVEYNNSGDYISIANNNIASTYMISPEGPVSIASFEHDDAINCIKWGPDAQFIVTGSNDRSIKFWG